MPKQTPCCARRTGRIVEAECNLRNLAKKAASHSARNHDITRLKVMIETAKGELRAARQSLIDHEADHAAEQVAV